MKTGNDYIEAVKKSLELRSYNQVGKALELTGSAISTIRSGGAVSEETATKIGKVLNIDPTIVYSDTRVSASKDNISKKFWIHMGELSRRASAAVLMVVISTPPLLLTASECILC